MGKDLGPILAPTAVANKLLPCPPWDLWAQVGTGQWVRGMGGHYIPTCPPITLAPFTYVHSSPTSLPNPGAQRA